MLNPTTVPPTVHVPCVCGLRRTEFFTFLWVRSPRTGAALEIRDGWFHELPPRIVARIAKTRSEGKAVVEFTAAELAALKATADRMAEAMKPRPMGSYGPRLSKSFSRPYHHK